MPTTGQPYFAARSITLQIFSANTSLSEPPKTVKSWLKTKTRRPKIVPYPVTTASPYGRRSSIPKFDSRWRTYRSSSTNEPGSHSFSARSRASSLPGLAVLGDRFLRAGVARLAAQLLQPLELLGGRLVGPLLRLRHRAERT